MNEKNQTSTALEVLVDSELAIVTGGGARAGHSFPWSPKKRAAKGGKRRPLPGTSSNQNKRRP